MSDNDMRRFCRSCGMEHAADHVGSCSSCRGELTGVQPLIGAVVEGPYTFSIPAALVWVHRDITQVRVFKSPGPDVIVCMSSDGLEAIATEGDGGQVDIYAVASRNQSASQEVRSDRGGITVQQTSRGGDRTVMIGISTGSLHVSSPHGQVSTDKPVVGLMVTGQLQERQIELWIPGTTRVLCSKAEIHNPCGLNVELDE